MTQSDSSTSAARSTTLSTKPVTVLKGVGAKLATTLAKLDIHSVQDLLFHLPFRYIDKTRIQSLGSLSLNDHALVQARVIDSSIVFGKRRALLVKVEDDSGVICLRFFHFSAAQKNQFEPGRTLRIFGELRPGASGAEMYHPEYEFIDDTDAATAPEATLTPLYHLTDGISQPRLRSLTQQAVELLAQHPPQELLPASVNRRFGIASLAEALMSVHFPPSDIDQQALLAGTHPFQQRLAFEELLAHFLARKKIRARIDSLNAAQIELDLDRYETSIGAFLKSLPFTPTKAQTRVFADIRRDLSRKQPMLRMLQGDVGAGKTLVAGLAALSVVTAGYQVALLAPTEILAEQHLRSFRAWFEKLGVRVEVLLGKLSTKQKRERYEAMRAHEVDLVIGTHALFQDEVSFANLGLAIIDEQHRFGVHQRLSLRSKSNSEQVPHQLVMTATPIPRTLAMASFAEMDFSVLDELPPGRKPIVTAVVSQQRKASVIERIRAACEQGRQIYWVCPLIEQSETLSVANAEETFAEIQRALPEYRSELIHGRLSAAEKEQRMALFNDNHAHILVATTVIEVGVDVPNASIMVIENPERLGLAQLHQLRGRVGRGSADSHCILLYGDKLSQQGKQRLNILRETNDGFAIADADLKMRGPGEFLGTRQAGDMLYRIADHQRDQHLYEQVHQIGAKLLREEPLSAEALVIRWLGTKQDYALA